MADLGPQGSRPPPPVLRRRSRPHGPGGGRLPRAVPLDQPPAAGGKAASAAADQRPALVKTIDGFRDWLSEWRTWARKEADRRPQSSSATTPSPALSPSTRRPL